MADVLGTFEQAVLLAFASPVTPLGKEAYGRGVLKEVQFRLDREVAAGAVYSTLDRLEDKGLISSRLGDGDEVRAGRPRRYYAIEAEGLRALSDAKTAMDRMWTGVKLPVKGTA